MRSTGVPRVALFTDSYLEANGVARTSMALEAFAAARDRPLLVVHGGRVDQVVQSGSVVRVELARSPRSSVALEHDLRFDPELWRQMFWLSRVLRWFEPDVLHFTGPSDIGQLGMFLGQSRGIPMVGSWHTNLHEYASRRLLGRRAREGGRMQMRLWSSVERFVLELTLLFYRLPRVLLAPNAEWKAILERRTRKPTFVMTRGVDTSLFTPSRRSRTDGGINIGYVGRLSVEKNVRTLARLYDAVTASGCRNARFTIVGDGAEREWLRSHLPNATFTGVLRGEALAGAYADFDLFVFPSETETVGNVVLEAMASGVPVVAMGRGGPKFVASSSASAVLAEDHTEFVELATRLVSDADRRLVMARAAREDALRRLWPAVFDTVYHAYDVAIARARSSEHQSGETLVGVPEEQSA